MHGPARSDQRFAGRMRAAQDGDAAAYAALLRDLLPLLRQAVRARRSFLQPQDVEDLVQDILLSLHAVRATYDPSRPFRPWLMAIVHNRMVDGARRYARRAQHEVGVAVLPETFSTPAANMTASYRDPEALRQAVRTLPRGQREAIEMLKLREMSLKEASAASGTSIGALKVAAHRGMLALRKALTAGERA
jgi:RNA polymerase sigma-70 factor (ECF subfamily)